MEEKVAEYNKLVEMRDSLNEYAADQLKKDLNDAITKKYLQILYSNPAGFNITARMTTNYRCLKNIYIQRKNHRLPEWREFCKWIETLPYFEELINTNTYEND